MQTSNVPLTPSQLEALLQTGRFAKHWTTILEDGAYFSSYPGTGGESRFMLMLRSPTSGNFEASWTSFSQSEYAHIRTSMIYGARDGAGRTGVLEGLTGVGRETGSRWWSSLMERAGGSRAGSFLRGRLFPLMTRIGQWPAFRTLGSFGASTIAFEIGWKIGDKLATILGIKSEPDQEYDTWGVVAWEPVEAGEVVMDPWSQSPATMQEDGFVAMFSDGHNATTRPLFTVAAPFDAPNNCLKKIAAPGEDAPGEGVMIYPGTAPEIGCQYYAHPEKITYATTTYMSPLKIDSIVDAPSGGSPDRTSALPSEPSLGSQEAAADDVLQDPRYAALNALLLQAAVKSGEYPVPLSPSQAGGLLGEGDEPSWLHLPSFASGEKYLHYAGRLDALGLSPTSSPVSKSQRNPNIGDDVVVKVTPGSGTRVEPNAQVKIKYNPKEEEAPADPGSEPGSEWVAPPIRDIDFSPLSLSLGCRTFPFGLFCWSFEALGGFGSSGSCSNPEVPMVAPRPGEDDIEANLPLNICAIEPALQIIRPVVAMLLLVSVIYMVSGAALGLGGGIKD